MTTRLPLLAWLAFACAAVLATPAAGASDPQVPAFTLKLIQARTGNAVCLPTRLPLGYRYERFQIASGCSRPSAGSGGDVAPARVAASGKRAARS